jgi:hypothetical protein
MPKIKDETGARPERLALNLGDLMRLDATVRGVMLAGKVDCETPVRTNGRTLDDGAVVMTCDLLTAACIADVIRAHDRKAGDYPCRCYLRRRDAWQRLPNDALLTVVEGERVVLNPALFREKVAPVPLSVPAPNAPVEF